MVTGHRCSPLQAYKRALCLCFDDHHTPRAIERIRDNFSSPKPHPGAAPELSAGDALVRSVGNTTDARDHASHHPPAVLLHIAANDDALHMWRPHLNALLPPTQAHTPGDDALQPPQVVQQIWTVHRLQRAITVAVHHAVTRPSDPPSVRLQSRDLKYSFFSLYRTGHPLVQQMMQHIQTALCGLCCQRGSTILERREQRGIEGGTEI